MGLEGGTEIGYIRSDKVAEKKKYEQEQRPRNVDVVKTQNNDLKDLTGLSYDQEHYSFRGSWTATERVSKKKGKGKVP